jgi:hypothetical protein
MTWHEFAWQNNKNSMIKWERAFGKNVLPEKIISIVFQNFSGDRIMISEV